MIDAENKLPKVSLAFLSWNRLQYLRATVESARECIDYPNLEWLISDNCSEEPGLRKYIESLHWFDHVLVKQQTHAEAMNQLVDTSTGDYILIWPDDVQFTVKGRWLAELVELLGSHPDIGSVCLDYMRRSTLVDIFQGNVAKHAAMILEELRSHSGKVRRRRVHTSTGNYKLFTMGWKRPGIVGSGIPSLTSTDVWRRLGPWRATGVRENIGLVDSSLGAESEMLQRERSSGLGLQRAAPLIPVAGDIITDPFGCKAKVRAGYRYGVYMPPPEGTFYYRIRDLSEMVCEDSSLPLDFSRGVEPLGFSIPVDEHGERKKSSINTSVVFDIARNEHIPFPLSHTGLRFD